MVRLGSWQFDVPVYFVARYFFELMAWAKNFGKIGVIKSIVLREGHYAEVSPNEEQGAELIVVKLIAKRGVKLVEAAPYRERDRRLIANHCQKMMDLGIPPQAKLIEPERPWLPFMPALGRVNQIRDASEED
jgi:hypothetical protein